MMEDQKFCIPTVLEHEDLPRVIKFFYKAKVENLCIQEIYLNEFDFDQLTEESLLRY